MASPSLVSSLEHSTSTPPSSTSSLPSSSKSQSFHRLEQLTRLLAPELVHSPQLLGPWTSRLQPLPELALAREWVQTLARQRA